MFSFWRLTEQQPHAVLLVPGDPGYLPGYQHATEFQLEDHGLPLLGLAYGIPLHG